MATGSVSLKKRCEPKVRSIHCRHGSWLLFLCVCLELLCLSPSESQQVLGYRPLISSTLNDDGAFIIPSDIAVTLQLFGEQLSSNTLIKYTEHEDSCDERDEGVDRIGGGYVRILAANSSVADDQYVLEANFGVSSEKKYYFCVEVDAVSKDYRHQGSDPWVTVVVQPAVLPLWVEIIFIIVLMILSGLFSGLNLGLMALDPTTLKIVMESGSKRQRIYAKLIYRVRRHGNYLLCTLLLGNVIVNSTLTILLDEVLPSGIYAVIASTLAIVIFGEIIPQAICSRHGLVIGAWTFPLTIVFMVLTFPLSLPLSLILNCILGKEIGAVYNRDQLLKLLHVTQAHHDLVEDEVNIISGVLAFKKKTAEDVMTKFEDVYCINIDNVLDFKLMRDIYDSGFSRIPIYEGEKNNIVGLLHVRDLAFVDPDDQTSVQSHMDFYKHELLFFWQESSLDEMLKGFSGGKSHLGIIQKVNNETEGDPFYEVVGVVTLEDIIEEILQREIVDETDRFEDNRSKKLRKRKNFNVGEFDNPSEVAILSSHQKLAVFQFLSSAVEPFKNDHISHNVLKRLLTKNVVRKLSLEDCSKTNFHLYTAGKEASYFTLILEGCMEVVVGKDGLAFESKSFTYFGAQALLNAIQDQPSSYTPDYTVRLAADSIVIIVTKRQYLAAREASRFEEGKTGASVSSESLSISQPKGDVFSKEWELAESEDIETSHSKGSGLSSITKLLHKKQQSRLLTKQPSSDQWKLLANSDSENSSSDVSPASGHQPLLQKESIVLEDRYHWLSLNDDNVFGEETTKDGVELNGPNPLQGIQDYGSEPIAVHARTSGRREDWAQHASTEV